MSSTSQVLGTIGALNTLIENFPMSIFDLSRGKTYTSSFEFLMDVLYACGVNTNDIISFLLEEIYSINMNIEGGLEEMKVNLAQIDSTKIEQSVFLQTLEEGIKEILKVLLSSIYGCTAIPVLPDYAMDIFNTNSLPIPAKLIDPMGMLEITPTSLDGRVYYDIAGGDVYYQKVKNETSFNTFSFKREVNFINVPINIKIVDNKLLFEINEELPENIILNIEYISNDNLFNYSTLIEIGENESKDKLDISNITTIKKITINNSLGNTVIASNYWCYIPEVEHNIFNSTINWGYSKENSLLLSVENNESYEYKPLNEVPEDVSKFKRYNNVPDEVKDNDPDFIVVYTGETPNNLYKSNDMNAFIWYSLVKSNTITQLEKNYTMWDSRLSAKKLGIQRNNENDWNNWYKSKSTKDEEFEFTGKTTDSSALFPILQLEKDSYNLYGLKVSFPTQKYYKPKYRKDSTKNPNLCFNSTIYSFNNDYLNNIMILKPKIMLSGLVNYMLGFTLSTLKSVDINFTKKMIESKLSTAIKNIIEVDDMEIEDCYTTFSNEEFDKMLEEMLLSRYTSTHYGGEVNKIKEHNIEYYMALIDSFNSSTTKEESMTKITRLVNEILVTPGNEGSINYGIEASVDNNLLQKLIWAITMPIMESLFTPQVMLLMVINMSLMGIVKLEDFANNDMGKIMNLLLNKILGLTKSIVRFIKDKIIELLLKLFLQKVAPLLTKAAAALAKEKLDNWLLLLTLALKYLPKFSFSKGHLKNLSNIDDVDYADIYIGTDINNYTNNTNESITPDTLAPC
jgi:hypothetical protein